MAIKIAESALKRRVGRVSRNTGISFFRPKSKLIAKYKAGLSAVLLESRNNHTGKLRTYSLFKQRLCREPYLEHTRDMRIRRCFTKLRIS